MDLVTLLLQQLTPEQRTSLLQQLLPVAPAAPAPAFTPAPTPAFTPTPTSSAPKPARPKGKSAQLDMSMAVPITFVVQLSPNDRARDPSWAQRFDHLWFKGHYQAKGPKGGVYCVGRAVLGNAAREQYKGTLKIANKAYLQLVAGEAVDGWFIPDDTKDNVLIGTLSHLQPK